MVFTDTTLAAIALGALGVALISLMISASLAARLRRLRRSTMARQRQPATELSEELDLRGFESEVAILRDGLSRAIQRVGLVRFDAFEDMGGRLSFAAALLDETGSGIVLSSINGRNETRIYAKPIEHGQSRINLSGEEVEAIRRALGAHVGA